jgi:hypothetical protein
MGSAAVLRERGDDRFVGALVRVGDGVEDGADVGGAAEARVRGEERVVGEGVGGRGNPRRTPCARQRGGRAARRRRRGR